MTLLDNVLAVLTAEMTTAGKSREFAALRPALLGEGKRTPYGQIAAELGLSEEAARRAPIGSAAVTASSSAKRSHAR